MADLPEHHDHARDALGIVHERFASAAPELSNGFAEHTTMGAEAMLALGIPADVVLAWADRHPTPPPAAPGDDSDALRRDLEHHDWSDVLRRRVTPLLGRIDAHLFHGLIRTAHAVRALEQRDDPAARAELAAGLTAWSRWAPGPPLSAPTDPIGGDDPLEAIVDAARRGAAAHVGRPTIVHLHAVTAPMAYLMMHGHLDATHHRVAAASFERSHRRHPPAPTSASTERPTAAAIATVAERWDAHPAKLLEAALRAHRLTGDGIFLDVAAMTVSR